jgi:PIN domain nuclease of toxin-antitoxin system
LIVLDTHVLHWFDINHPKLGPHCRAFVSEALEQESCAVSCVSFWELAVLAARGRIRFPRTIEAWRLDVLATGLLELPLDGTTALRSVALDLPHKDPADRFIVATALHSDATLVTADEKILAWSGSLARLDARR